MSVTDDQQLAGAIMKIGGSLFLWAIIIFMFFKRFGTNWKEEATYRRHGRAIDGIATDRRVAGTGRRRLSAAARRARSDATTGAAPIRGR